jgi:hypothetical protein
MHEYRVMPFFFLFFLQTPVMELRAWGGISIKTCSLLDPAIEGGKRN